MHPHAHPAPALLLPLLLALACSSSGDSGSSGESASKQASSPNLVACGDGTVLDSLNELLWETKTGEFDIENTALARTCDKRSNPPVLCPDTRDVFNKYTYCFRGAQVINCAPGEEGLPGTGTLFSDFLGQLNCDPASGAATDCEPFAGQSDWRIPTSEELRTIMVGTGASSTQPQTCLPGSPCIDGAFDPTPTPTVKSYFWSSSPYVPDDHLDLEGNPDSNCSNERTPCHQSANFVIGGIVADATPRGGTSSLERTKIKMHRPLYARAVRNGDSCAP